MDSQTTAPPGQRRLLRITALALTVALAAVILGITATRTPGSVDAQSDNLIITAITATSTNPGEIVVDLKGAPDADEYRVSWAKEDEDYRTWTDESANAFPTTVPYTITGLEEGSALQGQGTSTLEGLRRRPVVRRGHRNRGHRVR